MKLFEIICDNCGYVHLIEAKTLKQAEKISETRDCCIKDKNLAFANSLLKN